MLLVSALLPYFDIGSALFLCYILKIELILLKVS